MRPLLLEVEGFSSFRNKTVVDFKDANLFALTGSTGAGKSSLLDAICFALYGSVPRYDVGEIKSLMHSSVDETRVMLDFEVQGKKYTVVRVLRKQQGTPRTKECRLECEHPDYPDSVLASSPKQLVETIENLLGLTFGEFKRCVILPQGEFASFMKATSGDRQNLLKRLLGLDYFEEIQKRARARQQNYSGQVESLEQELERLQNVTEEDRDRVHYRFEKLSTLKDDLILEIEKIEESKKDLEKVTQDIRDLEAAEKAMATINMPSNIAELTGNISSASHNWENAKKKRESLQENVEIKNAELSKLPSTSEMYLGRQSYRDYRNLEEDIEKFESDAEKLDLESNRKDLQQDVQNKQNFHEEICSGLRKTEEELADVQNLRNELPIPEIFEAMKSDFSAYEDAIKKVKDLEEDVRKAEHIFVQDSKYADEKTKTYEKVRQENAAYQVAEGLKVGDLCPVCGEVLTKIPEHMISVDLEKAKQEDEEARGISIQSKENLEKLNNSLQVEGKRQEDISAIVERYKEQFPDAGHEHGLADLAGKIKEINNRLQIKDEQVQRLRITEKEASKAFDEAERTFEGATARLNDQRTVLEDRKKEALKKLKEIRLELDTLPEEDVLKQQIREREKIEDELKKIGEQRTSAEKDENNARDEFEKFKVEEIQAQQYLSASRDTVVQYGAPIFDSDDLLKQWEEFLTWIRTKLNEVKEQISQKTIEKNGTESDLKTVLQKISERCREVDIVEVRDEGIQGIQGVLYAELGRLENEAKRIAADLQDKDKKQDERKSINTKKEVAADLVTHMRKENFERWYLQEVFAGLITVASEKLLELSGGQYTLKLAEDAGTFLIVDHYNASEERSVDSLSGGETFLASLSLATALADEVTRLSAKNSHRPESLFLDEGFGALDQDTLEIVASTIEQLGSDDRVIGIVTHVPSLAERMPVRYHISKEKGISQVIREEL
tara:strand:+ start:7233 stop:10100 length:2868 start_codon:yes stop_codon:yes gene_type:complete